MTLSTLHPATTALACAVAIVTTTTAAAATVTITTNYIDGCWWRLCRYCCVQWFFNHTPPPTFRPSVMPLNNQHVDFIFPTTTTASTTTNATTTTLSSPTIIILQTLLFACAALSVAWMGDANSMLAAGLVLLLMMVLWCGEWISMTDSFVIWHRCWFIGSCGLMMRVHGGFPWNVYFRQFSLSVILYALILRCHCHRFGWVRMNKLSPSTVEQVSCCASYRSVRVFAFWFCVYTSVCRLSVWMQNL